MKTSLNKIRWQCRRGMLELDMILISFFDNCYESLTIEEQGAFIRLLEYPDPTLYAWLMGRKGISSGIQDDTPEDISEDIPEDLLVQHIIKRIKSVQWEPIKD